MRSLVHRSCEWRRATARCIRRRSEMVVYVTETADLPGPPPAATARRWQRAHGQAAVDWMHSSGVAHRMLADICTAVETTVGWLVDGDPQRAQWVLRQYPQVLSRCDDLRFNDPAQALAYLILHLPDRYARMFQVLEHLLLRGALPLGKSGNFAAIDIGAGPGPGIFAIRGFYAALAHYASIHDPSWRVATPWLDVRRGEKPGDALDHESLCLGSGPD
jgi:hypothetical protein